MRGDRSCCSPRRNAPAKKCKQENEKNSAKSANSKSANSKTKKKEESKYVPWGAWALRSPGLARSPGTWTPSGRSPWRPRRGQGKLRAQTKRLRNWGRSPRLARSRDTWTPSTNKTPSKQKGRGAHKTTRRENLRELRGERGFNVRRGYCPSEAPRRSGGSEGRRRATCSAGGTARVTLRAKMCQQNKNKKCKQQNKKKKNANRCRVPRCGRRRPGHESVPAMRCVGAMQRAPPVEEDVCFNAHLGAYATSSPSTTGPGPAAGALRPRAGGDDSRF